MPWARLDDSLTDHPKIDHLLEDDETEGLAALGLWAMMLAYCSRHLTDGKITRRAWLRIAPERADDLIARLVAAGMLEEVGSGFQIHDYLDFNPSKEKVEEERRSARVRMNNLRTDRRTNGRSNGVGSASPSHPIPLLNRSHRFGDGSAERERVLPGWPAELADTALKWARYDAPNADDDELRARCEQRFGHMLPNAGDQSE